MLAAGQGAGAQPGQQAGVEQRGLAGAGIADDGEEAAGRVAQTRQQLVGLAGAAEEDGGLGLGEGAQTGIRRALPGWLRGGSAGAIEERDSESLGWIRALRSRASCSLNSPGVA